MIQPLRGAVARAATAPVLAAALTLGVLGTAPAAHASESPSEQSNAAAFAQAKAAAKKKQAARKRTITLKRSKIVLKAARSRQGARYVYGGTGPWGFDCSGFTGWVYKKAGEKLPRTSRAQVGATRRISRGDARPGDLVFFHRGGRVYHVAIYAGGNSVYHASRPGTPVGKGKIWTSSIFFGRVK